MGTTSAPHLVVSLKPTGPINTKESFVQVVCAGRPDRGMPAWCPLGEGMIVPGFFKTLKFLGAQNLFRIQ